MGYDEHFPFSAAPSGETGLSRFSADVRHIPNSGDFDHDAQDAGSVLAHRRDACASFELRHFLARHSGRRLVLRAHRLRRSEVYVRWPMGLGWRSPSMNLGCGYMLAE